MYFIKAFFIEAYFENSCKFADTDVKNGHRHTLS